MDVKLNINKINIHPTDKKIKKVQKAVNDFSALPREMPLEPSYNFDTLMDRFENIKNKILVSIDNMRDT